MLPQDTEVMSPNLPPWWRVLSRCRDGTAYVRSDELVVISNLVPDEAGEQWLHVSLSRHEQPVTLRDLQDAKLNFIGPNRIAVQILPAEARCWAGLRCFHLWASLTGQPFPRFLRASAPGV